MKPSELRIGNYILHKGLIVRVQCLFYDDQFCDYITEIKRDLNDAEGIPLTEEWLLKFGFNLDRGVGVWFGRKYAEPAYYFTIWDKYSDKPYQWTRNNPSDTIPVKYVHQLQNLYFALTAEELTIKE
jgi:hypothetical protein